MTAQEASLLRLKAGKRGLGRLRLPVLKTHPKPSHLPRRGMDGTPLSAPPQVDRRLVGKTQPRVVGALLPSVEVDSDILGGTTADL